MEAYLFINLTVLLTLLVAAIIDQQTHTIPNGCPIALVALGTVNCLQGNMSAGLFLLSILFTGTVLLVVALLSERIGGCLGGGDIKLLAALAGVTGLHNVVLVTLLANVMALIILAGCKVVRRCSWSTVSQQPLPMAPLFFVAYLLLVLI